MDKKMTKKETEGIIYLALIGGVVWLAVKSNEALGGIGNVVIIGIVIAAIVIFIKILSWGNEKKAKAERRKKLMQKYNNEDIVNNIMSQIIWQGQTANQIIESLGQAEDVDQKVLKTKKKEIWKYGFEGGNRYRLRITLENDVVVGWDQR